MNIKRELIALAIRILADNTAIVRKPEPFEVLINSLFGYETYDQRLARNVEVELDRVVRSCKNARRAREFEKIVQNY